MKISKLYVFFTIIISFINLELKSQVATDTVNPNGYNVFHYPNGFKLSEGYLRDGKPDGYWITYYVNGNKKSEGNRKNFMLDSIWIFYAENGDTLEKISYVENKKNGWDIKYYTRLDSGVNTVKSKELYLNDKKQGWAYYYYPSGELRLKVMYKDNYKHGKGFEYSKDGRVIAIDEYRYDNLVSRKTVNRYNEKGEKDGLWVDFFDDGKIKSEITYQNNLPNGVYKEYNPDGRLVKVERYEFGKLKAVAKNLDSIKLTELKVEKKYYPDGKLKAVLVYKDSIYYGTQLFYDRQGNIRAEIYNEVGVKTAEGPVDTAKVRYGTWKLYYENGKLQAEGNYKKGKREGKWIFYYDTGEKFEEGNYIDDYPDGEWVWYFKNGNIMVVEHYDEGIKTGLVYELNIEGDTVVKGYYKDSEKNGHWYYRIGDEYSTGDYYYGKKTDLWTTYYYPEMTKKCEDYYSDGTLNGKHRCWYLKKRLKETGEYYDGLKTGKWIYYLPDGNIDYTAEYIRGQIVKVNDIPIK